MINGPSYEELVKDFWVREEVYDKEAAKMEEFEKIAGDESLKEKRKAQMGLKEFKRNRSAQAVGQQSNVGAGANAEVRMLETFLRNHPPTFKGRYDPDVAQKWLKEKEIEFLELKQGDMSVTKYAAKFVELAKFYPYYTAETTEFSKCIKFENGLRADIKRAIGYQKIRLFSELVSSCRIYEEDTKAHYKGHKSNVCNDEEKKCFRCGKKGHTIAECKRGHIVCFNCDEEGHLSSQCKKPKKAQASGRVFALAGTQTADGDRLI
ncbi:uncharacterized protein [Medicago truncatula]|uniref:uncharacterized protein n=1 Tax=Medicago truncatula TaxID=3880 RepID=UPI0019685A03|nr:uncharacterized protein LOC112420785 [Medicago truncatula]